MLKVNYKITYLNGFVAEGSMWNPDIQDMEILERKCRLSNSILEIISYERI